jgi:hypothetical protein
MLRESIKHIGKFIFMGIVEAGEKNWPHIFQGGTKTSFKRLFLGLSWRCSIEVFDSDVVAI